MGVHPYSCVTEWDANRAEAEACPEAPLMSAGGVSDTKSVSCLQPIQISSVQFTYTRAESVVPPFSESYIVSMQCFVKIFPPIKHIYKLSFCISRPQFC